MFVCEECTPEKAKWRFMLMTSYGSCEVCRKARVCIDYHGDFKNEDTKENENERI